MQASSGVEIVATKTVACVEDDRQGRGRENFRRVTIRALSACFARVQTRRLTGSFVHEEGRMHVPSPLQTTSVTPANHPHTPAPYYLTPTRPTAQVDRFWRMSDRNAGNLVKFMCQIV